MRLNVSEVAAFGHAEDFSYPASIGINSMALEDTEGLNFAALAKPVCKILDIIKAGATLPPSGLIYINGMSASSRRSASANRISLLLIGAISQSISSMVETHLACILRGLFVGIGMRRFGFFFRNEGACKPIYTIQAMFFDC